MKLDGIITPDGDVKLIDRHLLTEWINQHKDHKITLSIEVRKKKRSNPQNSYYWSVVVPMIRDGIVNMGNDCTLEEAHELLKMKFNYKEIVNEESGEVVQLPKSTTKLNTIDFTEYLEKIQRFAATFLNIVIPSPNQQLSIITAHYDKEVKAMIISK